MRSYAWSNKQENMTKAREHTNMVNTQYANEVASVCSYIYMDQIEIIIRHLLRTRI